MEWIKTCDQMPPQGEWVLVTTDDWQKPCEIMCYQGVRVIENECNRGRDRYFPSWTSGHGDIMSKHPTHWIKLPDVPNYDLSSRRKGHWITEEIGEGRKVYCSECKESAIFEYVRDGDIYSSYGHGVVKKTKYCPNCCARMESEDKE